MSRAVVIKYRFRGGHQIHVVACDCAVNSAAKPIDQLRKYSAAYPAQKMFAKFLYTPFFRASGRDRTLAAERFLTFAPNKSTVKNVS
jgi:hypothetical protein